MKRFPSGKLGKQTLEFFSAPHRAPVRPFAVLVFAWYEGKVLLCDIENRGWCIPGGRVEANESLIQAAKREALEEAGALIDPMQYIGCFRMSETMPLKKQVRWAAAYAAHVEDLVEIDPNFESRGRKLCKLEDLPKVYYHWNEQVADVFNYSQEVLNRLTEIEQYYT